MIGLRTLYAVGAYCFLPHPCGKKGHWCKTDRCVAHVGCSACGVRAGELCVNGGHPSTQTHYVRRNSFARQKKTNAELLDHLAARFLVIEEKETTDE